MTTTEAAPAAAGVIGQRLLRREDPALLTAEATFTTDIAGTTVGDHTGVTARTTTASPDDGGQS